MLKKTSHYFKNYHKHLTIYADGTGILINTFDIVFNKEKIEDLKRGINIGDGKKSAKFPALEEMKRTDLSDRFEKYGLWLYSDNDIISGCQEKYWTETSETHEDAYLKQDDKVLRWIFHFNPCLIEENKPYHVIYMMSIPGMFPLTDGKLDLSCANDENLIMNKAVGSSSSMRISNKINNLRYIVSFESKIELETSPECDSYVLNHKADKQKKCNLCVDFGNVWMYTI